MSVVILASGQKRKEDKMSSKLKMNKNKKFNRMVRTHASMLINPYQEEIIERNVGMHMMYIFTIVLYDKCGMSFKKISNMYDRMYLLEKAWRNDSNLDVTSQSLLNYANKKKLFPVKTLRKIPMQHKLFLTDLKGTPVGDVIKVIDSKLLLLMLLTTSILKESYRFSNEKMQQFYDGIAWYIDLYNTFQPGIRERYCNDNMIRQIFIDEEHWDLKKGLKVI